MRYCMSNQVVCTPVQYLIVRSLGKRANLQEVERRVQEEGVVIFEEGK